MEGRGRHKSVPDRADAMAAPRAMDESTPAEQLLEVLGRVRELGATANVRITPTAFHITVQGGPYFEIKPGDDPAEFFILLTLKDKVDSTTAPAYSSDAMDEAAKACMAAADYYGLPVEKVQRTLEALRATERETTDRAKEEPRPDAVTVKAASRAMLAARKRGPRGPRVKPNPRLPETAPEIYKKRERREELCWKKENIIQFIERVYAPWREILTRADLRRLDQTADAAVENWITAGKRLPEGVLLTEYELNTTKRQLEANRPARKPQQRFARMLRGDAPAA